MIQLDQHLTGMRGETLRDESGNPILLRWTLEECLIASYGNEDIDGKEKMKRFLLCRRIVDAKDETELKAEEIAKLKELIAKRFPTLLVGIVWNILDPAEGAN